MEGTCGEAHHAGVVMQRNDSGGGEAEHCYGEVITLMDVLWGEGNQVNFVQ